MIMEDIREEVELVHTLMDDTDLQAGIEMDFTEFDYDELRQLARQEGFVVDYKEGGWPEISATWHVRKGLIVKFYSL